MNLEIGRAAGASVVLTLVSVTPSSAQAVFVDRTSEVGVVHEHIAGMDRVGVSEHVHDWCQSGIAVGDIDGDGDLDVVACGGLHENTILLREGDGFVVAPHSDEIEIGAFDRAPSLADADRDGDLDLFVGSLAPGEGSTGGRSRLYLNDGTGHFTDVTPLAATTGAGHSIFAKWWDLDHDGLLDLYVAEFHQTKNRWYRNNGDGSFTDLSTPLGLDAAGSTHVVAILDTDEDGLENVFVGNDYVVNVWASLTPTPDFQLDQQPDGTFHDDSALAGMDQAAATMGISVGDVDYDGDLDLYKTEGNHNFLLVNHGFPSSGLAWTSEAAAYGVSANEVPDIQQPGAVSNAVGWTAIFLDVDLDLWLDLFVVNGFVPGPDPLVQAHLRHQKNFLFRGMGPSAGFAFEETTAAAGLETFFDERAAAAADFDSDGDLDLLVGGLAGPLRYYENQLDPTGLGWLRVEPVCLTSAAGGLGTRVSWTDSLGFPHVKVLGADAPTASQAPSSVHFGLGSETSVDVTVEFVSGITMVFPDVPPNTLLEPVEPELFRLSSAKEEIASLGGAGVDVTVLAHDAGGNPLDGSAVVTIDVPGLVPAGGVVHVGGNEFVRSFAPAPVAGQYRAEATFDGWAPSIRPSIHYVGLASLQASALRAIPATVRAGSGDAFAFHVVPKDANGVAIGPGKAVEIGIGGATPLGPTIDHGDGRYSREFAAPAAAGQNAVDVTYEGRFVPAVATVPAAGPVDPAKTTIYVEQPNPFHSSSPHLLKARLLPRDQAGVRLGPGCVVEVELFPSPGSTPAFVRTDLFPGGQPTGDHLVVVEKDGTTDDPPASGMLELRVDGTPIGTFPYGF